MAVAAHWILIHSSKNVSKKKITKAACFINPHLSAFVDPLHHANTQWTHTQQRAATPEGGAPGSDRSMVHRIAVFLCVQCVISQSVYSLNIRVLCLAPHAMTNSWHGQT